MHFLQPGTVSRAYSYLRDESGCMWRMCRFFPFWMLWWSRLTDTVCVCVCIWLLFCSECCSWLMGWVSIVCLNTMLNVVPATQTIRERHFLAVDKNKPREAPARPTNSSQGSAPTGGNNQNQQQPPPDLVCRLFLYFRALRCSLSSAAETITGLVLTVETKKCFDKWSPTKSLLCVCCVPVLSVSLGARQNADLP